MPGYQRRLVCSGPAGSIPAASILEGKGVQRLERKAMTQQERAAAKRREKLAEIQEQIDDGSLVVRQMTPEERKRNPPRPRQQRRRSR
jgi:hypothetical protein